MMLRIPRTGGRGVAQNIATVALIPLLVSLLSPGLAHAWSTPREAIDHFLVFELNGGRVLGGESGESREKWKARRAPYLVMPSDYDESGWDGFDFIAAYQVNSVECVSDARCTAVVQFTYETDIPEGWNVLPSQGKETDETKYEIVKTEGHWLITPPDGWPRIFMSAYRQLAGKRSGRSSTANP